MKKKLASALLAAALIATTVPVTTQAEVIYEEQDSGTNMGQSFTGSATVTFGQTPSFTVKIPKTITLDTDGAGKYVVGVKGQIPSKYTVNVVPDKTIVMEEENNLLDSITADVTAGKTKWTATELNPDSYAENEENTIQMQSIDYGKFEGTLNFNVSAEKPKVELKDASDDVKTANNFLGELDATNLSCLAPGPQCFAFSSSDANTDSFSVGDIIWINGGTVSKKPTTTTFTVTLLSGYYRKTEANPNSMVSDDDYFVIADTNGELWGVEYLGESYLV